MNGKLVTAAFFPLILVVDDDLNHRDALIAQIELLGYSAVAASNGVQALELLSDREFAVVLLSWLPDLDGDETLRRLRAREDASRHTPVLAMVADAVADARARCLAAGANDVLGKPFVARELVARLLRWAVAAPRPATGDTPLLDASVVDSLRQLKLLGRLYPAFITALPDQIARFFAAVEADDRASMRMLAHTLRGSSGQLGAAALSEAFGVIEDALANGGRNWPARPDPGAELRALVRATTAAMSREAEATPDR